MIRNKIFYHTHTPTHTLTDSDTHYTLKTHTQTHTLTDSDTHTHSLTQTHTHSRHTHTQDTLRHTLARGLRRSAFPLLHPFNPKEHLTYSATAHARLV